MLAIAIRVFRQPVAKGGVAFGDEAVPPAFEAVVLRHVLPQGMGGLFVGLANGVHLIDPAQEFPDELELALEGAALAYAAGLEDCVAQVVGQGDPGQGRVIQPDQRLAQVPQGVGFTLALALAWRRFVAGILEHGAIIAFVAIAAHQ